MIGNSAYMLCRRFLGVLGIALYPLVVGFGGFGDNGPEWYYSISASAYTNAAPIFIGIMCMSGAFLIAHGVAVCKPYGILDCVVNIASGVFALLIAFFSCQYPGVEYAGIYPLPIKISALIHNISAAAFFALCAFSILFLFTKNSGTPTPEKLQRNFVYRICGIGILCFMAFQALTSFVLDLAGPFTMMNEIAMLVFYDIAWLVKSEAMLPDKIEGGQINAA